MCTDEVQKLVSTISILTRSIGPHSIDPLKEENEFQNVLKCKGWALKSAGTVA